ncbi:cytochrome b/b6 domain-containing protein [Paracoccus methylovorus]|uniref:Cytochrome b/b6 domain-containing protein n=1 Tax=Paracoccus methylovorus TaxID=2812658 RepID=A0ABX7JKW5_9RHOB|nr:cytochrome b/b6 domain-containing protein [Paracoccus methylovorus]QRZ14891.1 cytochrome b/b6 domain-containing protein [Paracoccus methylovorus]
MKAVNTPRAYGWVARFFHWTVAVLILAAIAIGLYAGGLPQGGQSQMEAIFAAYSVHKTLGMVALILVALRLLWTLTQTKPRPLHPQRRLENLAAEVMHGALWIGMIVMPLSGWLLHSAAPGGFARILWPFGQRLPFIPEDAALSGRFADFHEAGWWLLAGLVVLHVAGALKHAIIDRDGAMSRMAGNPDRAPEPPSAMTGIMSHVLAAVAACTIWVGAAFLPGGSPVQENAPTIAVLPQDPGTSGWIVEQGVLNIEVTQAGNAVTGQFDQWQADIAYDPENRSGRVTVIVDIASLTLGAVGDAAKGPDFLNAATHPTARFEADILPPAAQGEPHVAHGLLTIAGQTVEADLPFELTLEGNLARATGRMGVDRRDFAIGANYTDESTVGFSVVIGFDLTANRQ